MIPRALLPTAGGLAILLAVLAGGCRSAYYAAWEKAGVYKRDLLKDKVEDARDDQAKASEQFKNALDRLKALYGFQGGDLESNYRAFSRDYEASVDRADAVRRRIREVETVAGDLFEEWEKEIALITSPTLQAGSRRELQSTRERYSRLHSALRRAEDGMEPVLVQFRDHVLFLKHNLNARAIASLQGEAASIQAEISKLIEEMNASIARADEFIQSLP